MRKELCLSGSFKILLICLLPGQQVESCIMDTEVMFYLVEGEGELRLPGRRISLKEGSLAVVPGGVERQLAAWSPMVVLAVQARQA